MKQYLGLKIPFPHSSLHYSWYFCTVRFYLPYISYLTHLSPIPTERTYHNIIQRLYIIEPCCHNYYLTCVSPMPNKKTLSYDYSNVSPYDTLPDQVYI